MSIILFEHRCMIRWRAAAYADDFHPRAAMKIDGAGVVSHLEVPSLNTDGALFRHSQSRTEAASLFLSSPPASSLSATMVEKGKSRKDEVVTREYTVNLHKRLHGCTFKKMAPKAVKEIRKFAQNAMKTSDVRLDVKLNKHLWSRGVRNVPTRVRVRIARKRNDDEDAKEEFYSYVSVAEIPAEGLRNLGTKIIEEDDE